MKKIILITTLIMSSLLFIACASLENKSFSGSMQTNAIRIESSGSANTGTVSPNIMIGGGMMSISTSRAFADSERAVPTLAYSRSSSFFGSLFGLDISSETLTYTGITSETAEETNSRFNAFKKILAKQNPDSQLIKI